MKHFVDWDKNEPLFEDINILLGGPRRNCRRTLFVEDSEEMRRKEMNRRRFWIIVSPNPECNVVGGGGEGNR